MTSLSEKTSSDESTEFTLKNLRESSSDDDDHDDKSYSDESSILTSDEENICSKAGAKKNVPKTEINVVIPNLELSLQSVRDEFRAERQKISKDVADWVYVSLDDRTDRSEQDENQKAVQRNSDRNNSEMKLRLSSSLSNRSSTPTSPLKNDTSILNESARSRRRSKAKDLNRYSEEFLMRESFDNRRPPSPKKKKSLTKKILENPERQSTSEYFGLASSENFIKRNEHNEKVLASSKLDSFAEKSYDSFFDLSVKRPVLNVANEKQIKTYVSQRQADDVDFSDRSEKVKRTEYARTKEQGDKTTLKDNEICVEDMENEVMSERVCDRAKPDHNLELNNAGENIVNNEQRVDEPTTRLKSQTSENIYIGTSNKNQDDSEQLNTRGNISNRSNNEAFKETNSHQSVFEEINNRNKTVNDELGESSHRSKTERSKIGHSSREGKARHSEADFRKTSSQRLVNKSGDKNSESLDHTSSERSSFEKIKSEKRRMSHDLEIEDKNSLKVSINNVVQQGNAQQTETTGTLKNRKSVKEGDIYSQQVKEGQIQTTRQSSELHAETDPSSSRKAKDESIRVVLNSMLASRDRSLGELSNDINKISKSSDLNNGTQGQTNSYDNQEIKTVEQDQIRVKLDLSEVNEKEEKKKKPVITPRRSLMSSNVKVSEESIKDKDNFSTDKSNTEDTRFSDEQKQNNKKSQVLGMSLEKEKKRDSGITPKRRSLPKHSDSTQPRIQTNTDRHPKQLEYEKVENVKSPKKNTIRVTLGKDPLAPKKADSSSQKKDVPMLTRDLSSPIPPPPPPPPPLQVSKSASLVSRSVQNTAPRSSMADELKSRLNKRQSVSEGMLRGNKSPGNNVFSKQSVKGMLVPGQNDGAPKLIKISEMDETLTPQQSEGLPSFVLQSMELQDQKDNLKSISRPHPHQLDDLSNASQEQLTSIADILKKVVLLFTQIAKQTLNVFCS